MPPPSSAVPVSSESKSLIKDPNVEIVHNIIPESVAGPTFTIRPITNIQKKHTKIYNSPISSDGLETGSDSDVREETESTNSQSKYLTNVGKLYASKSNTEHTIGEDQSTKSYKSMSRPVHTLKDNKYVEPSFKTYTTFMPSTKEDTTGRDTRDLLSNYETPFLSEFTRRLSSRTSLDSPVSSLSTISSKLLDRFNRLLIVQSNAP